MKVSTYFVCTPSTMLANLKHFNNKFNKTISELISAYSFSPCSFQLKLDSTISKMNKTQYKIYCANASSFQRGSKIAGKKTRDEACHRKRLMSLQLSQTQIMLFTFSTLKGSESLHFFPSLTGKT